MELGVIPTEQIVLVSAALTGYIAYQSRLNGIETSRERERYLNSRLEGATVHSDRWGVTIDNVQVQESRGILYRMKKFLTGSISGEVTVVVRYENISFPGDFWDTELGKSMMDAYPGAEVEHLRTQEERNPTVARFSFDSLDDDDIIGFFDVLLKFEKEHRPIG